MMKRDHPADPRGRLDPMARVSLAQPVSAGVPYEQPNKVVQLMIGARVVPVRYVMLRGGDEP